MTIKIDLLFIDNILTTLANCDLWTRTGSRKGLEEPSQSELSAIIQLIQMGYFNLNFAVDEASKKLNLNITRLYDQKNQLIKAYIQK